MTVFLSLGWRANTDTHTHMHTPNIIAAAAAASVVAHNLHSSSDSYGSQQEARKSHTDSAGREETREFVRRALNLT